MTAKSIQQVRATSDFGEFGEFLTEKAQPVTREALASAREVVIDLLDTMEAQDLCVGLSANQIGSSLAVAVVSFPGKALAPLAMFNPRVLSATGKKDVKRESCMSVWGKTGDVERRDKVIVEYEDGELETQRIEVAGFIARIVQHEVDHLNGVLFFDHVHGDLRPTAIFENFSPNVEDQ